MKVHLRKKILFTIKNASNGKKVGIKRAASPTPVEIKKRTKSAEEKASAVFKESSDWE